MRYYEQQICARFGSGSVIFEPGLGFAIFHREYPCLWCNAFTHAPTSVAVRHHSRAEIWRLGRPYLATYTLFDDRYAAAVSNGNFNDL